MDLTIRNNDKYNHNKYQGKHIYAHKKFGTCISSTPPKRSHKLEDSPLREENTVEESIPQNSSTTANKRLSGDIFRPYALPDNEPRKRKSYELQSDQNSPNQEIEFKRFAHYAAPSPLPAALAQATLPQAALPQPALPQAALPQPALPQVALPQPALPQRPLPQLTIPQPTLPQPAFPTFNTHFVPPATTMFDPFYRLQPLRFDSQTFSLILRKQSDTMCIGEILKRQANLNFYNLMGQF